MADGLAQLAPAGRRGGGGGAGVATGAGGGAGCDTSGGLSLEREKRPHPALSTAKATSTATAGSGKNLLAVKDLKMHFPLTQGIKILKGAVLGTDLSSDLPRMALLAGIAAAAVAIGVGELVGALLGGTSIIAAVGAVVISLQPPGGKDLMVALFGTNDKLALEIMTGIGGLLVGGLLGLIARRDMRGALAGYVAIGVVGVWLLLQDPLSSVVAAALTVTAAAHPPRRASTSAGGPCSPSPRPSSPLVACWP